LSRDVHERRLTEMEDTDRIFQDIDYRVFAARGQKTIGINFDKD
jgi:hypothetical protein